MNAAATPLARIARALRLVTVPLPHLSGLVAAARVTLDARLPTMGVFASGRLIANPDFVAKRHIGRGGGGRRRRPGGRARARVVSG